MAQERIDIIVRTDGITVTKRELADIGRISVDSARGVGALQNVLRGLGAGLSLKGVFDELNKLSELKNRIASISEEGQSVSSVFNKLATTANNVRAPLVDVTRLFQRVAFSVRDMGRSQDDAIRITELLSKSFQLSGATSVEAAQSARQFAQALSRRELRGDELNSLLEEAPGLAKAFAEGLRLSEDEIKKLSDSAKGGKQFFDLYGRQMDVASISTNKLKTVLSSTGQVMQVVERNTQNLTEKQKFAGDLLEKLRANQGVSVADLKRLSEAGILSAERLLQALERQGSKIDDQFKRLPSTLSQAVTVVRNNLDILFFRFDELTGITGKVSDAIIGFANNTKFLEGTVIAVATVAIPLLIAAIARLTVALLGSGFGVFVVLLGAAVGALVTFRNEIKLDEAGLISLGDVFNGIGFAIKRAIDNFKGFENPLRFFGASLDRLKRTSVDLFSALPGTRILPEVKGAQQILRERITALEEFKRIEKQKQDDLLRQSDSFLQRFQGTEQAIKKATERVGIGQVGPQTLTNPTVEQQGLVGRLLDQNKVQQEAQTLETTLNSTFNSILDGARSTGSAISEALVPERLKDNISNLTGAVREEFDRINSTISSAQSIGSVLDSIFNTIKGSLIGLANAVGAAVTELASVIELAVAKILNALSQLPGALVQISAAMKQLASQNFDTGGALDRIRSSFTEGFNSAQGSTFFKDLFGDAALGSIISGLNRTGEAAQTTTQDINQLGSALNNTGTQGTQALNNLGSQGGQALQNLGGKANEMQQQLQQLVQSLASGLENAVVDFVTKGKFDFKSLINSWIADITRFAFRTLILKPLLGMFGLGGGGGGSPPRSGSRAP